jgi:plastocyanin
MRRRGVGLLVVGTLVWLGVACSDDDEGPGVSPLVIQKPATNSGDQQTGPVGTELGDPLRVLITRDGAPVEDVDVDWSAGQGGTLSDETESGEDGIATVVWTLGPEQGEHSAMAAVEGAEGSPLTYTATAIAATPPSPTVQVLGPDGGNRFDPEALTVTVGQTVTWVWPAGSGPHNVVPDDRSTPGPSGQPAVGPLTYSFTFNEVGAFRYYCQVHGAVNGVGMAGRVIVHSGEP